MQRSPLKMRADDKDEKESRSAIFSTANAMINQRRGEQLVNDEKKRLLIMQRMVDMAMSDEDEYARFISNAMLDSYYSPAHSAELARMWIRSVLPHVADSDENLSFFRGKKQGYVFAQTYLP